MSKGSILDRRVRLRPNKQLLQLLNEHAQHFDGMPDNVAKALKHQGYSVPDKVEIFKEEGNQIKKPKINVKLLKELLPDITANQTGSGDETTSTELPAEDGKAEETAEDEVYLYLSDLKWLNTALIQLRSEQKTDLFLHQLLEPCVLDLPQNEVIVRNPELEERCQKLRVDQENLVYRKMTKNVDSVLKNYPEDTIAYQIKSLNSQLIAVAQFVFSVAAGFTFGFLGIELIIGNLEFGFRLLLGIICALVIALAEIYFLAKKLIEYDDVAAAAKTLETSPNKKKKAHAD